MSAYNKLAIVTCHSTRAPTLYQTVGVRDKNILGYVALLMVCRRTVTHTTSQELLPALEDGQSRNGTHL